MTKIKFTSFSEHLPPAATNGKCSSHTVHKQMAGTSLEGEDLGLSLIACHDFIRILTQKSTEMAGNHLKIGI